MCTADPLLAKRYVRINNYKRSVLQKSFAKNTYPSKATLHELSNQLGLNIPTLQRWFRKERQTVINEKHQTSSSGEYFPYVLMFIVLFSSNLHMLRWRVTLTYGLVNHVHTM